MEDTEKSPIIDRLCNFIAFSGLSNSQFADKAGIPRPSLSQMLHGRNKSLNNQVLEKLNDAFPELNVLWLLFGQGDMLTISNIEFSERQKQAKTQVSPQQSIDFAEIDNPEEPKIDAINSASSVEKSNNTANFAQNTVSASTPPAENGQTLASSAESSTVADIISRAVGARDTNSKKIASIIVLYSDNSFDTFLPSKD